MTLTVASAKAELAMTLTLESAKVRSALTLTLACAKAELAMTLTLESAKVRLALTFSLACAKAELADDLDRVGSAAGQLKQKDAKEEDNQHGTEADQQACGSRFAARRLGRRHWGIDKKTSIILSLHC